MDNNQEENREYGGMPVPQQRGPRHRFRINRGKNFYHFYIMQISQNCTEKCLVTCHWRQFLASTI